MRKRKHRFLSRTLSPPPPTPCHKKKKKTEKIPGASRQHTYREPGQPETALRPASCPGSELDWDSEQKWQAEKSGRISLKDHQADPRLILTPLLLGRSPPLCTNPFLEGPPVAGWELPSPLQERRGLSPETQYCKQMDQMRAAGRRAMPVAQWGEQSLMGLSSLQSSISVFMLLPRSCPVISLYSFPELPFLLHL